MIQNSKTNWSQIRKALNALDKPTLIQLVGQLAARSEANGRFLSARFYAGKKRNDRIAPYQTVIQRELTAGFGLDFAVIRRAIRDYWIATGDTAGVLELQLGCIEAATTLMNEIGIHGDDFYADLYEVVTDFEERLRQSPAHKPHFADRIRAVMYKSGGGGYGYEDMVDLLASLIDEPDEDQE